MITTSHESESELEPVEVDTAIERCRAVADSLAIEYRAVAGFARNTGYRLDIPL